MSSSLQSIKENIEGGSSLNELLNDELLSKKISNAFCSEAIFLLESTLVKEEENLLHYQSLVDTLLGVSVQHIDLIFYTVDDELHCSIRAELPPSWNFSWSYPCMPQYDNDQPPFFETLEFEEPMVLLFCSQELAANDSLSEYFTDCFGELDDAQITEGLNFISALKLARQICAPELEHILNMSDVPISTLGDSKKFPNLIQSLFSAFSTFINFLPLSNITAFLSDPIALYGHLEETRDGQKIMLELALPALTETTGAQALFNIDLTKIKLYSSTSAYAHYIGSGISFTGNIGFGNHSPTSVEVTYPMGSSYLTIQNVEEIPLIGFDVSDDNDLPVSAGSFTSIAIRQLSLSLSFDPFELLHTSISMGPNESWNQSILGESLSIEDLLFRFELDLSNTDNFRFYTLGAFLMGGGLVNVSASYPDMELNGELALYQTISVDQVIGELLGNPNLLPNIDILDLAINTNLKEEIYSFQLQLASDWELDLGIAKFLPLKDLFITVEKNKHTSLFAIDSTMEIAEIDLLLLAVNTETGSSSGWDFSGRTGEGQHIAIGELIKEFFNLFGVGESLPKCLTGITVYDLGVSFNTETRKFTFDGAISIPVTRDSEVNITLFILLEKADNTSYKKEFKGTLLIGSSLFTLTFAEEQDKEEFEGSWKQIGDEVLGINEIAACFGLPDPHVPKGLDLALKEAKFLYDIKNERMVFEAESRNYGKADFVAFKDPKGNWQYFSGFGLKFSPGINLSNIPLINQVFSENQTVGIENIQIVMLSDDLAKEPNLDNLSAPEINALITDDYPKVGADGLPKGAHISLDLNMAGLVVPLSVGTGETETLSKTKTALRSSGKDEKDNAKDLAADGTLWYSLQQKFGPVTFEKIGIKYKEGGIYFAINAALNTSGLQMELITMAIGTKLDEFDPRFSLSGIGMGYQNSSFTIEGTFAAVPTSDYINYTGGAVLETKAFSFDAFGSYCEVGNQTSMFVFAQINRRFGGPPAFFVTGLLGGFGYNSHLRIPDMGEVRKLPLIGGLDNPDEIGGPHASPTQALQKLMAPDNGDEPWVSPKAGNIWLAAGVKFSSFELIESTALMVGEFGRDFSMAILGVSEGKFPKKGNQTYAYFALDLRAYLHPSAGEISFSSILSSNSFVLDKNCKITGGFAFYLWFGNNRHAGDFVISMGGYSSYYRAPSWYPKLTRVGLNWRVDSHVTISGGGYFALTPAAVMAGGNIELLFKAGNLRAWVKGNADIVLWWNPFYFVIDIGVSVGASYTFKAFGNTCTAKVELGCNLSLWGPGTGGKVKVSWFIISFTISFGAKMRNDINQLNWEQFKETLPENPSDLVKVIPINGLTPYDIDRDALKELSVKKQEPVEKDEKLLVRPNKFEFTTSAPFPCHELTFDEEKNKVENQDSKQANIKPMGKVDLNSTQHLTISRNRKAIKMKELGWTVTPNTENVASSLWGIGNSKVLPPTDQQLIKNQSVGFTIAAPLPIILEGPGIIDVEENLSYSDILTKGENPILKDTPPSGKAPKQDSESVEKIGSIESKSEERKELYQFLINIGIDHLKNDSLEKLATESEHYFTDHPLTV